MPNRMGEAAELLAGAAGTNLAHKAEDIVAKFKKQPDPTPSIQSLTQP